MNLPNAPDESVEATSRETLEVNSEPAKSTSSQATISPRNTANQVRVSEANPIQPIAAFQSRAIADIGEWLMFCVSGTSTLRAANCNSVPSIDSSSTAYTQREHWLEKRNTPST